MAATRKRSSTKSDSKKSDSKKSEQDQGCQKVVTEYFDLTGDTLEKQVEMCREISRKIAEGDYSAEDAQRDWQESVNRAADYSREATRLWIEGMTCCAWVPGLGMPLGFGNIFGGDSSGDKR